MDLPHTAVSVGCRAPVASMHGATRLDAVASRMAALDQQAAFNIPGRSCLDRFGDLDSQRTEALP